MNLDRLKYSLFKRLLLNIIDKIKNIPKVFINFFKTKIPSFINRFSKSLKNIIRTIIFNFKDGNLYTRISYIIMGIGHFRYKRFLKGIIYLLFETIFVFYMFFFGWKYLSLFSTLGKTETSDNVYNEETGIYERIWGDNSMLILLYSVITLFFILCFIFVWYQNIKESSHLKELNDIGQLKKLNNNIKDIIANKEYHRTLLTVPTIGLTLFTILPIVFMILVAFTNWDVMHYPPEKLFTWVGFNNFIELFGGGVTADTKLFFNTFKHVLLWTFVWAVFATFTNYFLGMLVAIMINKKGIKFKKMWRTILIFTIAVPQFVSLLLMSKMLADKGIINILLEKYGIIKNFIPFLSDATIAKVTIIVVNIWIGVPYTMLITTGILLNIPSDLYEAAKIDGASPVRMYFRITLPYMLFVTGPYLVSTFIGNINNFNVIYLLTGGNPKNLDYQFAGDTDLLITWLYKLTLDNSNFKLASVIGLIVFIIVAFISLIFYSKTSATSKEGDFS